MTLYVNKDIVHRNKGTINAWMKNWSKDKARWNVRSKEVKQKRRLKSKLWIFECVMEVTLQKMLLEKRERLKGNKGNLV